MAKNEIFVVKGGNPISGIFKPQGNKNEALPILAASILTNEPVYIENLPDIEDVRQMIAILRNIGLEVSFLDPEDTSKVMIRADGNIKSEIPKDLSSLLRGSVTLAGPLLARNREVFLPRPGGDRIGRRRLDTHILAFRALGAEVKIFPDGFEIKAEKLRGADILLDEASVTATENAICAAVFAEGETIIRNAASEPHVQNLCHFLNSMGAKIEGIGSNILKITGVSKLRGTHHKIGPDYLEVGSLISLAAVTKGELIIEDPDLANLRMIRMMFSRLGILTRSEKRQNQEILIVPPDQTLKIEMDIGGAIPKIESAPWPGFPADMTSVALVTATQCEGTILIHEKLFESRLFFTDRLISMGARIVLCDPHRAVVIGPTPLQGSIVSSPDIRAGMAMLIATLCADGESIIQNVHQIDRGFSRIEKRLQALGAKIQRKEI
ncbi:MAG: UDP-N-acetylglucosamine 1-carboxyvinyltransferase [Leptospiraceae bacterium]|nr:UDP-N-acetylglucosamine 1-carboxyvinyltransferase [Leptospiraceae bacterium]MDW7975971.1 UDP-N-acetylglucosamine 1-carboxyvinyltransferase [Leptospiraceae bacterium]